MGMDIPLLLAFLLAGASAFLFHLSLEPKRQVCPSCSTKMDVIGIVGILGAVYECPSCHFASDFNTVEVRQSTIASLFFRFLGFFFSLKRNKPRWHARYMKLKSQIMHADVPLGYYLVLPITLFALWQFSLANELMRSMYMASFLTIFPFQRKKHHCDVCGKQTDGKIMQMKNGHKRYFCSEKCELEYVAKPLVEEQLVDSTRRKALKALGLAGLFGAGLLTGKLSDVMAASPATPTGVVNGWAEVGSASVIVFADDAGYYYVKDTGAGLSQASPQIGQLIVNQNVITSYGASFGAGTAGASTTTAGIQEAINSLGGMGTVFIKASGSMYILSKGLVIPPPGVVIIGESGIQSVANLSNQTGGLNGGGIIPAGVLGNYTNYPILRFANGVNQDMLSTSATSVNNSAMLFLQNLWIDGNKANNTSGHGINCGNYMQIFAKNLVISNFAGNGIYAVTSGHILEDVTVNANNFHGIQLAGGAGNCIFRNVTTQGHANGVGIIVGSGAGAPAQFSWLEVFVGTGDGVGLLGWNTNNNPGKWKITAAGTGGMGVYLNGCSNMNFEIYALNNGQSPSGTYPSNLNMPNFTGNESQCGLLLLSCANLKISGQMQELFATGQGNGVVFDYNTNNVELDFIMQTNAAAYLVNPRNISPTFSNINIKGTIISASPVLSNPYNTSLTGFLFQIKGFNPVGFITAPAVPASGATNTVTNTNPYPVEVFINGSVTGIYVTPAGKTQTQIFGSVSNATVRLNPGDAIALVYTTAPTWTWYGL
jgi:hypothetical protein